MEKRFRLLKVFSVTFKVLSLLMLALMVVGLVGIAVGEKPQGIPLAQVVTNMIVAMLVTSLMFYSLGEIIRVLLAIEEQTRKS